MGKYTKYRSISIPGLKGLEYNYSINGISKKRSEKRNKDQVGGWYNKNG